MSDPKTQKVYLLMTKKASKKINPRNYRWAIDINRNHKQVES